MSRDYRRTNRFRFAEYDDMDELARTRDTAEIERILWDIVRVVLDDEEFKDTLSVRAQANFLVPLGLAAALLEDGGYSAVELVSAACTVRYFGEPHLDEFPAEVAGLLTRLPR